MRILVVEDDEKIARFICDGLSAEHYSVSRCDDGAEALNEAMTGGYDLMVLDAMLPSLDGFEVLRRLREAGDRTIVIMLTAKGTVEDRVRGLEVGADDYLTKPFSFVELLARIRALLRRHADHGPVTTAGSLVVDFRRRTVTHNGTPTHLSPREFQLLAYFVQHPDQVLTRAMIADRVWGYQFDTGTNVIDVYVNYLRRKIGGPEAKMFRTTRGVGYSFHPEPAQLQEETKEE